VEAQDWISLLGILFSGSVAVLTVIFTDRARKRERQADKEDKDRAGRQAKEEREATSAKEERRQLLASLIPLVSLLGDRPPSPDASDQAIKEHIERLRSDSANRAVESVVLVGLIYPSPTAQKTAGWVRQALSDVVLAEEMALKERNIQERRDLLERAAEICRWGELRIRDLAREIRGPLPWEDAEGRSTWEFR
jgi:hypothetical protein